MRALIALCMLTLGCGHKAPYPVPPPSTVRMPSPQELAQAPPGAPSTENGVPYVVLRSGSGAGPQGLDDTVRVHYAAWHTDGALFDSSWERGQPADFPLKGVIPGFSEVLLEMQPGEIRRCWIPEELAYKGRAGRPAGTLVYEIELISVTEKPQPPPAPRHLDAPSRRARTTESGLIWEVLAAGTGDTHPGPSDTVTVHYSIWNTEGELIDSSVARGSPNTFRLTGVIPGMQEGVQLMVVGERALFRIPEELAYKGRPGAPQGTLIMEIELLGIE